MAGDMTYATQPPQAGSTATEQRSVHAGLPKQPPDRPPQQASPTGLPPSRCDMDVISSSLPGPRSSEVAAGTGSCIAQPFRGEGGSLGCAGVFR